VTAGRTGSPRLPPRWLVRSTWFAHGPLHPATRGRVALRAVGEQRARLGGAGAARMVA